MGQRVGDQSSRLGPAGTDSSRARRPGVPWPVALVLAAGVLLIDLLAMRFRARPRAMTIALVAVLIGGVALAGLGNLRPAGGSQAAAASTAESVAAGQDGEPTAAAAATAGEPLPTPPGAGVPRLLANQAAPTPTATATLAPTAVPPTAVPPTATATVATPRGTTVIPILMYHYVRTVTDPTDTIGIGLSVTPAQFAAQMQYLADAGYTTLTMGEVRAILAGELALPERPIALTFDDGYRDFYTAAWPVLKRHNFKATNYVIADFIGWDAYLTWPMIKELDASGLVEIGSHTRTHGDLRGMTKERRWNEIAGSKAILEEGLGRPVTAFCYPAGKYNPEVVAAVRQAGYLTATTVEYGTRQNLEWNLELPRIRVNGPDNLATWRGKLP